MAAVEDEFLLSVYMIGTEKMVADRMAKAREVGITTLRVAPVGRTAHDMIENLERTVEVIRSVGR